MTSEHWSGDTIVKIDGKTFSCEECGSNVFRKRVDDPLRYRCNGCGALYRGEETSDEKAPG